MGLLQVRNPDKMRQAWQVNSDALSAPYRLLSDQRLLVDLSPYPNATLPLTLSNLYPFSRSFCGFLTNRTAIHQGTLKT